MIDSILHWNEIAVEATRVDFSSPLSTVNPEPEQPGPTRTSRALAIVHLAMYDAFFGVRGGSTYLTYSASEKPPTNDLEVARAGVATAAALTLLALYPRQRDAIRQQHLGFVAMLGDRDPNVARGIAWGETVANKILAARQGDGAELSEDFYVPSPEPLRHRVDPLNPGQGFFGPRWGRVKPFGINDLILKVPGSPPPNAASNQYTKDFNEVKTIGRRNSAARTSEQTVIGLFWAYDGARNIGVPPRLYNQIVRAIALQKGATEADHAKLFALVNVAMADAGIQCWQEKYFYDYWRPVVGVREASPGYGPTGQGDGNPETVTDSSWLPLGSPRTNQPQQTAFTPGFPAYPSGHATFGTAALRIAQLALGLKDDFAFTVVSDELDGSSVDEDGSLRVRHARSFTIKSAIEENLSSRVYLGVHWRFDGEEGKANGMKIADMIFASFPALA